MKNITRVAGNHLKSPPVPEDIITSMRKDKEQYSEFADWIIRSVHGKCGYADKAGSQIDRLGTFIPISQEAFALLLYKNGYDNWLWMHNNAATSEETEDEEKPGYRYTNKKEGDGLVFTSRNGGWSAEGMIEYNRLCKLVTDDRRDDRGEFDLHYREHWRSTMKPSKYKKQRRTRENPVVAIYTDLEDLNEIPGLTTASV